MDEYSSTNTFPTDDTQTLCGKCSNNNPDEFDQGFCFSTDSGDNIVYYTCGRCDNVIGEAEWKMAKARVDEHGEDELDEDFNADEDPTQMDPNLIRLLLHKPCSCGNSDPDQFKSVTDHKDIAIPALKYCLQCKNVSGVDDSIDAEECQSFLRENQLQMEPCIGCGTTNPDDFFLEEIDGRIVMKCHACQNVVDPGQSDTEMCEEDAFKAYVEDIFTNCACGNADRELFSREYDGQGFPHRGQCLVCGVNTVLGGRTQLTCYCRNFDPMQFLYISDQEEKLMTIRCLNCLQDLQPGKWLKHSDLSVKGKSDVCAKTRITRLDKLQAGDHVSWHRDLGYWHHALVTEVGTRRKQLKVIEYMGPIKTNLIFITGEIVEHWIEVDARKDEFYRFDYSPSDCRPPEEAIRLARLRLGEKKYSLPMNNCEHFVRCVKLNKKTSLQVKTFKKEALRIASIAVSLAPKLVGKRGLGRVFGTGSFLALEVTSLLKDLQAAMDQRRKKMISRTTFVKIVLKRAGQTVGAGAALILGTLLIPECMFGALAIGGCIALGSLIGMLVGKQAANLIDHWDTTGQTGRYLME